MDGIVDSSTNTDEVEEDTSPIHERDFAGKLDSIFRSYLAQVKGF